MKWFWLLPLIGLVPSLNVAFETYARAETAPQQGVGAAYSLAWVVIPYCIARATAELAKPDPVDELKRLNEAVAIHTKLLAAIANSTSAVNHGANAE